jgi:hypothetical protein
MLGAYTLLVISLAASSIASADVTFYSDRSAWVAAAAATRTLSTLSFEHLVPSGAAINGPFVTQKGVILGGTIVDPRYYPPFYDWNSGALVGGAGGLSVSRPSGSFTAAGVDCGGWNVSPSGDVERSAGSCRLYLSTGEASEVVINGALRFIGFISTAPVPGFGVQGDGVQAVADNVTYDVADDSLELTGAGTPYFCNCWTPVPGESQASPILPPTPGRFVDVPGGRFVDPPLADGYAFRMTSAAVFTSILDFPTGFLSPFAVWSAGRKLGTFGPENDYVFNHGVGVTEFEIRGISPLVDSSDPLAFPIRLAFDVPTASFTMMPLGRSTVLGKSFVVKDPAPGVDASLRSVVVVGKEQESGDSIAGNPLANGATIEIIANGASSSAQTFTLPPGAYVAGSPGWKAIGNPVIGYSYKDTVGANGPVKAATIKRTATGTLIVKATIKSSLGPGPQPHITVVPPAPGTDGGMRFIIHGGDTYCVAFGGAAGGTVSNTPTSGSPTKGFKIANPTLETSCPEPQ